MYRKWGAQIVKKRKLFNIIIQSVFLAFTILFFTLYIMDRVLVDRATQLPHTSHVISSWEWVRDDGTRQPVYLPRTLPVEKGETVVLETKVPFIIREGYWLMFYNSRDVKIYIGDELRYSFVHDSVNIKGGIVKGFWSFTKLLESDYGKTIRIVRDSDKSENGTFKELYYGDGLGVCYEYVKSHAIFYFFSVLLVVLAIIMIVVGTLVYWISGNKIALIKLGIGMMCAALWLIFDSEMYQLIFDDYYVDGIMSYMVITVTSVPLLQYINHMQKCRQEKIHTALCFFNLATAIVLAILHFAGISSYDENTMYVVIMYIILTIGALYTIVKDYRAGFMHQYRYVALGMYGFFACVIVELVLISVVMDRDDGAMLLAGLYILLISGLIQQVVETYEADRARRQAQEANKQKSTFLANMSHEIRTPINSIIGMNEMILRENKDPQINEYAMQVASSGRLLLGLINDVLDFSKIEAGKMDIIAAPFDTAVLINDIEVLMRERAGTKKLTANFDIATDIPSELSGDEVHLKQIIVNLISNAVKYTHEGSITLTVDCSPAVADNTTDLRIIVSDTGIGIRQENLDKLFDTFTRVDERRNVSIEGTGLGLSIVKNLVSSMGGTIDVESTYGVGSKFTVSMPLEIINPEPIGNINAAGSKSAVGEKYVEQFHAPKASILAVDDNMVNLKVVCELLKATQISIDTASGGRECVYKCRDKHYDLILMDHRMPDPDGVETLHLLRADFDGLNENTPVIVLTANAFAGIREKYVAEGFVDYLSKPIDSKLLESKIMKYLPAELIVPGPAEKPAQPKPEAVSNAYGSETAPASRIEPELSLADRLRAIKDMDYDATVETYGGSEEFMSTLLTTIVQEGYNKIERMKTSLANKDYKKYRIDAHAAKSDMAVIGAKVISERAKAHEYAARDEGYAFIERDFEEFIAVYRGILDRIGEALKINT